VSMCSGNSWCVDAILAETGPELTELALEIDNFDGPSTFHRLEHLHSLRELKVHNTSCRDMHGGETDPAADFGHMTVCQ
jgi:hypothetical protein